MSTISTLHNTRIPPMPADTRVLVWLDVGHAVAINERSLLSAWREVQDGQAPATLLLRVHLPGGTLFHARQPEDLAHLTTDAIVRCVESDASGPLRVLVEIGDHVAYPQLREQVAA